MIDSDKRIHCVQQKGGTKYGVQSMGYEGIFVLLGISIIRGCQMAVMGLNECRGPDD